MHLFCSHWGSTGDCFPPPAPQPTTWGLWGCPVCRELGDPSNCEEWGCPRGLSLSPALHLIVPGPKLWRTVNPGKAKALVLPAPSHCRLYCRVLAPPPPPPAVSSGLPYCCVALSWSLLFSGPPGSYCELIEDNVRRIAQPLEWWEAKIDRTLWDEKSWDRDGTSSHLLCLGGQLWREWGLPMTFECVWSSPG